MHKVIVPQRSTQDLLALLAEQQSVIAELSQSHLGIMSGSAIRRALRLADGPLDIIACDWRKLHEWNDIIGYDMSNVFIAEFAQTRRGRDRRRGNPSARCDLRGQWGGDELVFAVTAGQGIGLLLRLVRALDALSSRLSDVQRARITEQTSGLINEFAGVFVLVPNSTDLYHRDARGRDAGDVARAVAECGRLKAGNVTGQRATSGRSGTIIGTLMPGEAT